MITGLQVLRQACAELCTCGVAYRQLQQPAETAERLHGPPQAYMTHLLTASSKAGRLALKGQQAGSSTDTGIKTFWVTRKSIC